MYDFLCFFVSFLYLSPCSVVHCARDCSYMYVHVHVCVVQCVRMYICMYIYTSIWFCEVLLQNSDELFYTMYVK